ncbi:hypothetical protein PG984_009797 [Apiospora sp. TS-2023a]
MHRVGLWQRRTQSHQALFITVLADVPGKPSSLADVSGCLDPDVLGPGAVEAILQLRQRFFLLLVLQTGALTQLRKQLGHLLAEQSHGQQVGLLHVPGGAEHIEEGHAPVLLYDHDVDRVAVVTAIRILMAVLLFLGYVQFFQRVEELDRVLDAGYRVPALVQVCDCPDVEIRSVSDSDGFALLGWGGRFAWAGLGERLGCAEDIGLRLVVLLLALRFGLLVLPKLVLPVMCVLSLQECRHRFVRSFLLEGMAACFLSREEVREGLAISSHDGQIGTG